MRLSWVAGALLAPAMLAAQATVSTSTALRASPDGRVLGRLRSGATVQRSTLRGEWTRVKLSGYLHRSVVGGKRDTFALSTHADGGALLRRFPSKNAAVLALLSNGVGLVRVSRRGDWLRVERSGWVSTRALAGSRAPTVASRPPRARTPVTPVPPQPHANASTTAAVAEGDVTPDSTPAPPAAALAVEHRATLYLAPEARAVGSIDSSTRVTPLARDRGWVRVQVEGWVRAQDLGPADSSVLTTISAADLRAQPAKYRGQTVRWQVQKIAVETADPLRKGMAPDEPYILARGPGEENSLLYLALPPSLLDQAKRIDPLAAFVVTARVRDGHSEPAGVPLLDVLSIATR